MMMNNEPEIFGIEDVINNSFKKYKPLITNICCIISIFLFIAINLEDKPASWDVYSKWGSPSAVDIFGGKYWGLITSNFLHIEWWHILFNLYWFWIFGKKIEFESSKVTYVLLILTSAFVSSASQLAFSSQTGIGLSGIVYAYFGYIFIKSKISPEYRGYINRQTMRLFIFWLFFCIMLTYTDAMNVANAAHFGGFLWGMLFAYIGRYSKYIQCFLVTAFLVILCFIMISNPFSVSYLYYKAYVLHENGRLEEAKAIYEQIAEKDPGNEFARDNLEILKIHDLSKKAYDLHVKGEYESAREVYNEILIEDPQNAWAKENIKMLPPEVE